MLTEQIQDTLDSLDALDDISFLDSSKVPSDKSEQYDIAVDIVLDILDSLINFTLGDYDDKALVLFLSTL